MIAFQSQFNLNVDFQSQSTLPFYCTLCLLSSNGRHYFRSPKQQSAVESVSGWRAITVGTHWWAASEKSIVFAAADYTEQEWLRTAWTELLSWSRLLTEGNNLNWPIQMRTTLYLPQAKIFWDFAFSPFPRLFPFLVNYGNPALFHSYHKNFMMRVKQKHIS